MHIVTPEILVLACVSIRDSLRNINSYKHKDVPPNILYHSKGLGNNSDVNIERWIRKAWLNLTQPLTAHMSVSLPGLRLEAIAEELCVFWRVCTHTMLHACLHPCLGGGSPTVRAATQSSGLSCVVHAKAPPLTALH